MNDEELGLNQKKSNIKDSEEQFVEWMWSAPFDPWSENGSTFHIMLIQDIDKNPIRKIFVVHKKEVQNLKFLIIEDE